MVSFKNLILIFLMARITLTQLDGLAVVSFLVTLFISSRKFVSRRMERRFKGHAMKRKYTWKAMRPKL